MLSLGYILVATSGYESLRLGDLLSNGVFPYGIFFRFLNKGACNIPTKLGDRYF